jgi:hypothetical protein
MQTGVWCQVEDIGTIIIARLTEWEACSDSRRSWRCDCFSLGGTALFTCSQSYINLKSLGVVVVVVVAARDFGLTC